LIDYVIHLFAVGVTLQWRGVHRPAGLERYAQGVDRVEAPSFSFLDLRIGKHQE
jgi:hypothetical protein